MNANDRTRLVLPGDLLGTAEEFVPGRGTYEDGGRIFSAVLGNSQVDPRDRAVRVDALHAIPSVEEEQLVYARVEEIKTAMAVCTVLATATSRRPIPGEPEGTVHISKAKDGYTEALSNEFAPGDILIARVLQRRPSIKLTTAEPELGVVAARCQNCHGLLRMGPKELVCPRCGNQERRKTAKGANAIASSRGTRDGSD